MADDFLLSVLFYVCYPAALVCSLRQHRFSFFGFLFKIIPPYMISTLSITLMQSGRAKEKWDLLAITRNMRGGTPDSFADLAPVLL